MNKGKTAMLFISSLLVLSLASPAQARQAQGQASQAPAGQKPAPAPYKPDFVIPKPDAPGGTTPAQAAPPQRMDVGARYVLGPQDQLKITVFDEPELSNVYRVDSDGFITFPMISKVAAVGITPAELQDRIKTMLASGYIKNPQVRVEVEGYKSQSVIVSGEIRAPGKVPMTGSMTLIEALAAAGSPTSSASNEVSISRQKRNAAGVVTDENAVDIIRVNLKMLQLGQAGRDIQLQDGDLINVPKAQTFYITGQIRNPGSLVWDPGMTVQQAVALAGGLTDRGSDRRIRADRLGADGKVTEVSLKLEDKVQPNDTIKIPSKFF
jgi:polysaccharide biosynthesis/export protein